MTQMTQPDRRAQDLGNIVFLEHVNLRVPDQGLATVFYLEGFGLTRDPYYMVGTANMWVNAGRQQLHLETGEAQHFRGHIGVVVPDLASLRERLSGLRKLLAGTKFRWDDGDEFVTAACPWGNRFRIHEQYPGFQSPLGIAYLTMTVPFDAAPRIASFYSAVLQADAALKENEEGGQSATVSAGPGQSIIYSETQDAIQPYDGHHICIYTPHFSGPYQRLKKQGLITSEDNAFQYRFEEIRSPGEPTAAYVLQHEVRSLHHPLYLRPLVNRTGLERLP